MLALVEQKDTYQLGDTAKRKGHAVLPVSYWREQLYSALGDPDAVRRIGSTLVDSYLRYRNPTPESLRTFPYLRNLMPPYMRAAFLAELEEKYALNMPTHVVRGSESWISKDTRAPKDLERRAIWLDTLNENIRFGSQRLAKYKAGDAQYEKIVGARREVLAQFGWTAPEHPLYPAFEQFSSRHEALVSPTNVISIFNMLEAYGVTDITSILKAYFLVICHRPEGLRSKLEVIRQKGFVINEVLHVVGSILRFKDADIAIELERRSQSKSSPLSRLKRIRTS